MGIFTSSVRICQMLFLFSALVLVGCGGESSSEEVPTSQSSEFSEQNHAEAQSLKVYCGRSESLVSSVIEQFEKKRESRSTFDMARPASW